MWRCGLAVQGACLSRRRSRVQIPSLPPKARGNLGFPFRENAEIAQLVEQATENRCVGGSTPSFGTNKQTPACLGFFYCPRTTEANRRHSKEWRFARERSDRYERSESPSFGTLNGCLRLSAPRETSLLRGFLHGGERWRRTADTSKNWRFVSEASLRLSAPSKDVSGPTMRSLAPATRRLPIPRSQNSVFRLDPDPTSSWIQRVTLPGPLKPSASRQCCIFESTSPLSKACLCNCGGASYGTPTEICSFENQSNTKLKNFSKTRRFFAQTRERGSHLFAHH